MARNELPIDRQLFRRISGHDINLMLYAAIKVGD